MPTSGSESAPPCELVDGVKTLILQEQSNAYQRRNYLREFDSEGISEPVNETCRVKMVEWLFMICDTCRLSRSVVPIAFSYVDRLLSKRNEEAVDQLQNREKYQLAVIVAFYIAVKINEHTVLSPDILARLSRGRYTAQEIENEEQRILQALDWRLFGPNASHFVHYLLELISPVHPAIVANGNTPPAIDEIVRKALTQVELSLTDQSLVDERYSEVALAALRNAIDDVGYLYCPPQVWAANFDVCHILVGIDAYSSRVDDIKELLRAMSRDDNRKNDNLSTSRGDKSDEDVHAVLPKPISIKREISSPTCVGRIAVES